MANDEGEEGYGPIRTSKLKSYAKRQTPEMWDGEEMWAKDDAIAHLEQQLLEVTQYVWKAAAEETYKDGRRIVKPDEIDKAFNEMILPQNVLQAAANEMQQLRWKFLDVAKQSPAINPDQTYRLEQTNGEEPVKKDADGRDRDSTISLDEFISND